MTDVQDSPNLKVNEFDNAKEFIDAMNEKGLKFVVHPSMEAAYSLHQHAGIRLGAKVDFKIKKQVIKTAKEFFQHLLYIHWADRNGMENDIFVGGSTETATKQNGLKPLSKDNFEQIETIRDDKELMRFLKTFEDLTP